MKKVLLPIILFLLCLYGYSQDDEVFAQIGDTVISGYVRFNNPLKVSPALSSAELETLYHRCYVVRRDSAFESLYWLFEETVVTTDSFFLSQHHTGKHTVIVERARYRRAIEDSLRLRWQAFMWPAVVLVILIVAHRHRKETERNAPA